MKSTDQESVVPGSDSNDTASSIGYEGVVLQTGVQRVEAKDIFLMAFCTSLDIQVTSLLAFYATSSFSSHSLLSTFGVVGSVLMAVVQPPIAKIAHVFGRTEAFAISMILYILGYIQMAASKNISTYASAQIFYAAGSTGLRILQWGYAMWTIITPVLSLPLFIALWINQKKVAKAGLLPQYPWKSQGVANFLKNLWTELDIMGVLLLVAAFSLLLVPLTLSRQAVGKWKNPSIIATIVIGSEMWKKAAPMPLLTLRLFKKRTVITGCVLGFFYFMAYYLFLQPYFYSYLMVARNTGSVAAGRITLTFSFAATVSSVVISLVIKYTKHYKYYMVSGILIYMLGIGLMLRYRIIDSSNARVIWTQIIVGIGEVAAATALFLTIVPIGGAVGSAVSSAIWSYNIQNKLMLYLPEAAKVNMAMIYGSAVMATSYPIKSPERTAIIRSYDETMRILLVVAVCVCIPMLPAGLRMANYKLDKVDQRVEGVVFGSSGKKGTKDESGA
ncbi:major facilitator superfamily domain-containing protein [Tuber borchii]|uniref:Major facilitator superfamily domain-containing protein n=1 Tax=Tuber borchii TaxID=42251 RepID=A0A2T7A3Z1_TUBBO|nr:major facilitator superfamily domain-containing protein [Tuber borchii]